MATINSYLVMEWAVNPGLPPTVRYGRMTPYSYYVADNVNLTGTQVIINYITNQGVQEQPRLVQLAGQGLLTLSLVQQVKATVPPLPPMAQAQPQVAPVQPQAAPVQH
jgi:hypothetical protein